MRGKSKKAATLAQELGSGASWANRFVPSTSDATLSEQGAGDHNPAPTPQTPQAPHELPVDYNQPSSDLPPAYDEVTRQRSAQQPQIPQAHGFGQTPQPPQLSQLPQMPQVPQMPQIPQLPQLPRLFQQQQPLQPTQKPSGQDQAQAPLHVDPARSHIRHENYASITGTYSFFDHLELTTTRGSIDIVLDPQPGVIPATLKLETDYGSIRVVLSDEYIRLLKEEDSKETHDTTLDAIYSRPWDVTVRAKHGSVEIRLPLGLGSRHFLKSRVGAISATFYTGHAHHHNSTTPIPINDSFWFTEIKTETHHGGQDIRIEAPDQHNDRGKMASPMTNIASDFWAKQHGSIRVQYPKSWEGRVQAKSNAGNAKIEGKEMHLQHFGRREVHGVRGVGTHMTSLRGDGAGSLEFNC